MLESILVPVSLVGGTGLIAGLILSIASKIFEVKVDETVVKLREALPGANCGACGCGIGNGGSAHGRLSRVISRIMYGLLLCA